MQGNNNKMITEQNLKKNCLYKTKSINLNLKFISKDDKNAYFEVIKRNGSLRDNGFFIPLNLLHLLKEVLKK